MSAGIRREIGWKVSRSAVRSAAKTGDEDDEGDDGGGGCLV